MRKSSNFHIFLLLALGVVAVMAQVRNDSISGRVVDQSGEALPEVMVALRGSSGIQWVKTSKDGSFTFSRLKPAIYDVFAEAPGLLSSGSRSPARPGDSLNLTMVPGGVITGRVTDQNGDPVIEVDVTTVLVKQGDGAVPPFFAYGLHAATDDRGIYRIYGLSSGRYLVAVNAGYTTQGRLDPFTNDPPTYYPSNDRASANEVEVQPGQEVTGIDIRFRSIVGHSIAGVVEGLPKEEVDRRNSVRVNLLQFPEKSPLRMAFSMIRSIPTEFSLSGVPDGDYELFAEATSDRDSYASEPSRITIRGSDVTGVRLKVMPLPSISGSISVDQPLEKARSCPNLRASVPEEVSIRSALAAGFSQSDVSSNREFRLMSLKPGKVRLYADLPGEHWYIRSISRRSLDLKFGDRITGVVVTIAQDGAQLSGKLEGEGKKQAFLVPAEAEAVDEIHKYVHGVSAGEGTFLLKNIAPGEYFFYTSPAVDSAEHPVRDFLSDEKSRARLRELATQFGKKVKLAPCQRATM